MKQQQNQLNGKNKGSSSVLVILIVLSLTIFGILGTITSATSLKLAKKNAQYTAEYYALESQAHQWKYQIKEQMDHAAEITKASQREDKESVYREELKRSLSSDSVQLLQETVLETDEGGNLIVSKIFYEENDPKGQFLAKIKILEPVESEVSDQKHQWKVEAWAALPREIEISEELEFENIQIDPNQSNQGE